MEPTLLKRICAEAAHFLAAQAPDSVEPELTRACSAALLDMAEHSAACEGLIEIGAPFLKEFQTAMAGIEQIRKVTRLALHDWVFSLFESLAILMREETLRNQKVRPAQKKVMHYFMKSGHWLPGDSTLVAEYFYRKLPGLLEDSVLKEDA